MINVELRLAFEWTCLICGIDHFERATVAEMSREDEAETKQAFGFEPWEEWHLIARPVDVRCGECGHKFKTVDYWDDE